MRLIFVLSVILLSFAGGASAATPRGLKHMSCFASMQSNNHNRLETPVRRHYHPTISNSHSNSQLIAYAAPEGALPDIVIPSIFNLSDWKTDDAEDEDPRVWVPQTECLSFRPLCFCTSQGYYVNLLKFKGGKFDYVNVLTTFEEKQT